MNNGRNSPERIQVTKGIGVASLVVASFLPSLALSQESHCGSGEVPVFSCEVTKGKKVISLCANVTSRALQYRYGPVGRPEMTYPAKLGPAADSFTYEILTYSGGGGTSLLFKNGAFSYNVYSNVTRDGESSGVRVERDGKLIANPLCTKRSTDEFGPDFLKKLGVREEGSDTPPQQKQAVSVISNQKALDASAVVREASGGKYKSTQGKYADQNCGEVDYRAELVDLNGDGLPEVFVVADGTCVGGMAGAFIELYVKNPSGLWKRQFGFEGLYTVLKTKTKGYQDIEIAGPGMSAPPVWKWDGAKYANSTSLRPSQAQPNLRSVLTSTRAWSCVDAQRGSERVFVFKPDGQMLSFDTLKLGGRPDEKSAKSGTYAVTGNNLETKMALVSMLKAGNPLWDTESVVVERSSDTKVSLVGARVSLCEPVRN